MGADSSKEEIVVCKDYMRGHCANGARCHMPHIEKEEMQRLQRAQKAGQTVCGAFIKGRCKYGDRCRDIHDERLVKKGHGQRDRDHRQGGAQRPVCVLFMQGRCDDSHCPNSHDEKVQQDFKDKHQNNNAAQPAVPDQQPPQQQPPPQQPLPGYPDPYNPPPPGAGYPNPAYAQGQPQGYNPQAAYQQPQQQQQQQQQQQPQAQGGTYYPLINTAPIAQNPNQQQPGGGAYPHQGGPPQPQQQPPGPYPLPGAPPQQPQPGGYPQPGPQQQPPPQREVCQQFLNGYCGEGERCQYQHNMPDKPVPVAQDRKFPCKYWEMGNCKDGHRCKYGHDPQKQGIKNPHGSPQGRGGGGRQPVAAPVAHHQAGPACPPALGPARGSPPPQRAPSGVTTHELKSGVDKLVCRAGDVIEFCEKENPTTGYTWHFKLDDAAQALPQTHNEYLRDGDGKPMCGSGGTRVVRWTATKAPSKVVISFGYVSGYDADKLECVCIVDIVPPDAQEQRPPSPPPPPYPGQEAQGSPQLPNAPPAAMGPTCPVCGAPVQPYNQERHIETECYVQAIRAGDVDRVYHALGYIRIQVGVHNNPFHQQGLRPDQWLHYFNKYSAEKNTQGMRNMRVLVMMDTWRLCSAPPPQYAEINQYDPASLSQMVRQGRPPRPATLPGAVAVPVEVWCMDCVFAATKLKLEGYNPCMLNMANASHPGGGFVNGAGAQEENLHRRSNYYHATKNMDRRPTSVQYPWDPVGGVYTPKVAYIRGLEEHGYPLLEKPVFIDCIGVAAISKPAAVHSPKRQGWFDFRSSRDRQLMWDKVDLIFASAAHFGNDSIVLGAFGCGAFACPANVVGEIFAEVNRHYPGVFKKVVVAIITDHNTVNDTNPDGLLLPFCTVLQAPPQYAGADCPMGLKCFSPGKVCQLAHPTPP